MINQLLNILMFIFSFGICSNCSVFIALHARHISIKEYYVVLLLPGIGRYVGEVSTPFTSAANTPATHALVIILRGIAAPWKQTVAYFLTGNSTSGELLWTVFIGICVFSFRSKLIH